MVEVMVLKMGIWKGCATVATKGCTKVRLMVERLAGEMAYSKVVLTDEK